MIRKLCYIVMGMAVLLSVSWGISLKGSYTDITKDENSMDQFRVGELTEELTVKITEKMEDSLKDSAYILRVEATGEWDHMFKLNRQGVVVKEVFKGQDVEAGDTIWLTTESWRFYLDDMTANMGFVNLLREGEEYLVFLEEKIQTLGKKEERSIFRVADYIMAPIFAYQEIENKVIPVSGDTTYVYYSEVRSNEFFVCSQKALEKVLKLKAEILQCFPRS